MRPPGEVALKWFVGVSEVLLRWFLGVVELWGGLPCDDATRSEIKGPELSTSRLA